MKSMLCEASSVLKAIESVWKQSGKPSEFSIKILEAGEKGILWFTKHPAIVSMSYDPRKQTEKEVQSVTSKREQPDNSSQNANANAKKKKPLQAGELSHRNTPTALKRDYPEPRQQQASPVHQNKQQNLQIKPTDQRAPEVFVASTWNDEQVSDITQWLQETIVILQSDTQFTTAIDKKTLRVTLDQYPIAGAEENKTLYISLGNLFMQALKKKHKKKFQGFNIIITLKGAPSNGNQKSNYTE